MNTARPYRIMALYHQDRSRPFQEAWAGRRTRTFATLESARVAAFKLAVDILTINPKVVAVEVQKENADLWGAWDTIETVEVTAA